MPNPSVHIEFYNSDPEAAAEFYSEVFGWEIVCSPMPEEAGGEYLQGNAGESPGVAYPKADGEMANPGDVLVYVHSDDIDATLAKIESQGGTVIVPNSEIPGIGWFAIFTDTAGNRLALFKSQSEQ